MQVTPEPHIHITDGVSLLSLPAIERARLACNTMQMMFPDAEPATAADKAVAQEMFLKVTDPKKPAFSPLEAAQYPTAALTHLDKMLSEYDHELVNSAVRIREYVKNKLLKESEHDDGKIRIKALELLGKMKDVGLFTDRVEVTHKMKTDEELEAELTKKLELYMGVAEIVEEPEEDIQEETIEPPPEKDLVKFVDSLVEDEDDDN